MIKAISRLFLKKESFCPLCNKTNAGFKALPDHYWNNALKYGYAYFGKGEMTAVKTYSCSNCGASDRERLYFLWFVQQIAKGFFSKSATLIHFAPERVLSKKIKQLDFFDYKTADLLMETVDYKIDIMNMPFAEESYDFFICSHILEHVDCDDKAIKELYRITKKGGSGILMAPIIVSLDKTIEDPTVKDEANRWRLFGQNDHVRLYAHNDYVQKIKSNGFKVIEFGEKYFGKKIFSSLGLKRTSILYVVKK